MRTGSVDEELIRRVTEQIVTHVQPEKIILFGSWAWGRPHADSDLDLLIIRDSPLRRDKRAREIHQLFASRKFPLDVLVYTPREVEMCQKMKGSFIRYILDHGRVLYEQPEQD